MTKGEKILNAGLKMCNYYSIFTSVIIIIGALVFIGIASHNLSTFETTDATVLKVIGEKCEHKEESYSSRHGSQIRNYEECNLMVGYNQKRFLGGVQTNNLETFENTDENTEESQYEFVNKITTKNVSHKVGETILVDYNIKDPNVVKPHTNFKLYLIIAFVVLFMFLLNIYVRSALYENDYVKAYIGLTCLSNITSDY